MAGPLSQNQRTLTSVMMVMVVVVMTGSVCRNNRTSENHKCNSGKK
jgi:hypothetical protein